MKIPKDAQEKINILDTYETVKELEFCDIIHMYDKKRFGATNKGFIDARFFDVWLFNTETKKRCKMENHDEIDLTKIVGGPQIRIYADGSTIIFFRRLVKVGFGQSLFFYEVS